MYPHNGFILVPGDVLYVKKGLGIEGSMLITSMLISGMLLTGVVCSKWLLG